MCLLYSKGIVNSCYFTLFLIKHTYEIVFHLLLGLFELFLHLIAQILLLFLKFFYSFIQYFNMQFELLLYFNMISYFGLVLL